MGRGDRNALRRRDALELAASGGAAALVSGCFGKDGEGNGGGGGDGNTDDSDDTRELVVGTAAEFPPFERTAESSIVGFDADLTAAVLDAADGYELGEWSYDRLFSSLPGALADGDVDVLAAALSITERRSEDFAFTEPYYETRQAALVADGGPSPAALEDLTGATLGAQTATTGEALVQSELIEPGLIEASDYASWDTYPAAVSALEQSVVDAVVVDAPAAWSFAESGPASVAFTVDSVERYGFGVRSDDEELRAALDEGLQVVRESGRYGQIAAEWLSGAAGDGAAGAGSGGNASANASGNESDGS